MEKFKCLVADDEQHAVDYLCGLINDHYELALVKATTNPHEAAAYEEDNLVDIAFIDLDMGEVDGRKLISQFSADTHSVMCTAYKDQGTSALHAGSAYFLSKPFDTDDFQIAVSRVIDHIRLKRADPGIKTQQESYFFPAENANSKVNIRLNEVLYFSSMSTNSKVLLKDGKILELFMGIGNIERELDNQRFMRIHRYYIVNLFEVEAYSRGEQHVLRLKNRETAFRELGHAINTLPVGRKYKGRVALRLG